MAESRDFETRGVAWRYNEIWYSICVGECVLSKDPGKLFGYRRLDFDKDVRYDELSSEESEVDTSKTAKASGSSTTTTQPQAKSPSGKTAAKVATAVTPGLLVAPPSFAKPTTPREGTSYISPENDSDNCEYGEGTHYHKLGEGNPKGSKD